MIKFINMDYDGTQWWVDYIEDGVVKRDYFANEILAQQFYESII